MVLLGMGLSVDVFSLTMALGTAGVRRLRAVQFALGTGAVHAILLLFGIYLGTGLEGLLARGGPASGTSLLPPQGHTHGPGVPFLLVALHVFAAAVLLWLGLRLLRGFAQALRHPRSARSTRSRPWPRHWPGRLATVASVSVDAASVGFGLALFGLAVWQLAAVVGAVVSGVALAGLLAGSSARRWVGPPAQLAGGGVLLYFGLNLLWQALKGAI